MKRFSFIFCSMLLSFGMVCFSNTAFASKINFISNTGYAYGNASAYFVPGDLTSAEYGTSEAFTEAKATIEHDLGNDVEETVEGEGFFRFSTYDTSLSVYASAGVTKDLPSGETYEYYAKGYAYSETTFSIESDYGRTEGDVEASYHIDFSFLETGDFMIFTSSSNYEIVLTDHYDGSYENFYRGWLDEPLGLKYGRTYTARTYVEVIASESNDNPDYDDYYNPDGYYDVTLDFTINLGAELPTDPVNPVPEPATMLLLGTGLVGFVGFGRKKFLKK